MKEKLKSLPTTLRWMFAAFTAISFAAALIAPDRADMLNGLVRICTLPGQTVKSYFDPTYGGVAGTFLNLALVSLVMLGIYCLPGAKPDGLSVLAFFLTAGFCFWGMTILNIWFTFAGVALYALVMKKQLGTLSNAMLFSTGLAPLITEMLFRYPGEQWHGFTCAGILIALAVGLFLGFILPAGLAHSPKMHKGYDLYSAAVPMGLAAFFLRGLLYKVFTAAPPTTDGVGLKDNFILVSMLFCGVVFGLCILFGLLLGGGKEYGKLLRSTGLNADYGAEFGPATGMLNLGVFGVFIVLYYWAVGATWNAATLGIVFCMACTAFKGSHPLNVWPIMVGYVLASFIAKYVCGLTGAEFTMAVGTQAIVIGLCYANGMSPVSGVWGWPFGILFGMVHYTIVTCVPLMHGGFLLYNGGFTAGITCMLMIPVVEHFFKTKDDRRQLKAAK